MQEALISVLKFNTHDGVPNCMSVWKLRDPPGVPEEPLSAAHTHHDTRSRASSCCKRWARAWGQGRYCRARAWGQGCRAWPCVNLHRL